ncbi:MAG: hypothetical protein LBG27_12840 [Spirochaetaceae bacterium]|nr:hypothetical protein [Spirochaetaceae bacterium]
MRFAIFCGEDVAPFKFRAVCIDLETDAVGNTVDEALQGLVRDTVHHVEVALEDFNGDREKTMDSLIEEMRDKSEARKAAELAYQEAKLDRLEMINRQAEIRRESVRRLEKEKRVRLQAVKFNKYRNLPQALYAFLFGYNNITYRYEAVT